MGVLLLGVEVLGLPRVPCVTTGVVVGAAVGFVLNKYFAFKDQSRRVGKQALTYGVVFAGELLLHTGLTTLLVHQIELHYLAAKFIADFLVFTCLHLLMLRYVVFRPARVAADPRSADHPPLADSSGR